MATLVTICFNVLAIILVTIDNIKCWKGYNKWERLVMCLFDIALLVLLGYGIYVYSKL